MTTNNVISELGNKWWPIPFEGFFTPQRSSDGFWCGDEMPPTLQDELASPVVSQSKLMVQYALLQQLAQGEQRRIQEGERRRRAIARSRIGKRAKAHRH